MTTAWIDADAITANTVAMAALAPDAALCAVVKADGYGHGAATAACAALAGGASRLAVARVEEAAALRASGIDTPIIVLSEPSSHDLDRAVALQLELVVYRRAFIDALADRANRGIPRVDVHLKVDTGMRRVGCEPADAVDLARRIDGSPRLRLAGTMSHLAMADVPDDPTTSEQLDRFAAVLSDLHAAGIDPGVRHAANSAATIAWPAAHLDMVRVGIALYGIDPDPALAGRVALRPAMRWTAPIRLVKRVRAGEAVSYGHRFRFPTDTTVATIAAGYADGVRRDLGLRGGQVLIGGRRRPIVGVVTMDQFVVDLGPEGGDVEVGDDAVLLGAGGDDEITANEVADRLDTIGYEVTCAVGGRVRRRLVTGGDS